MRDLFVARNILFYVGNQKTSWAKELYETYYLWGTFVAPIVHQETPCIYLSYDLWTVRGQTWMSIQSQSWIVLLTSEARKMSNIREIVSSNGVYVVPNHMLLVQWHLQDEELGHQSDECQLLCQNRQNRNHWSAKQ